MKKISKVSAKNKPKFQLGKEYLKTKPVPLLPKETSFSTTAPYNYGNTSYLNKRYGNVTNQQTVGDITPDLKQRILNSNVDLGYRTNIGRNRVLDASAQINPLAPKTERVGTANVTYEKANPTDPDKKRTLTGSTQVNPYAPKGQRLGTTNLAYSAMNRAVNQGSPVFRTNVGFTPRKDFSTGFNLNDDLEVNYRKTRDDQGVLNSVQGRANFAKPFSFTYSQDYRKGQPLVNQRVSGDVTGKKFKGSAYKNYSQDEGKTYGGSLSKYTGDVTYGASADYNNQGLKTFSANLNTPIYDLAYTKDRLNNQNTVQADFKMGKPVSVNYSRTFSPGQRGTETLGGKVNVKNTNLELQKTLSGPQQGTYTGSLKQKLGPVNLTASGTKNNQGLQNYNVGTSVDVLKPNKKNPNRGTLNVSGSLARSKGDSGSWERGKPNLGINYSYAFKNGGKKSKSSKLKESYLKRHK